MRSSASSNHSPRGSKTKFFHIRQLTVYYLGKASGGLNPADASRLRAEIVEQFAANEPRHAEYAAGFRWKEICDPALPVPSEPLKSSCASTRPPASEAP